MNICLRTSAAIAAATCALAARNAPYGAQVSGPLASQTITAHIQPAAGDVGKAGNYYLAALVGTRLYFYDGHAWIAYGDGPLPVYLRGQLEAASLPVVVNTDLRGLGGTRIFAGYGTSDADLIGNGKYAQIYAIPAPQSPALAVSPASLAIAVPSTGSTAGSVTDLSIIATGSDGAPLVLPEGDLLVGIASGNGALATEKLDSATHAVTTGIEVFPSEPGSTVVTISSKSLGLTTTVPVTISGTFAYTGPQGVYDEQTSDFLSIVTLLDTGEVYGMDIIGSSVAGFYHGSATASGGQIAAPGMTEFNAMDGGYVQSASLSGTFAGSALNVTLGFEFGRYQAAASGQRTLGAGDNRAIYTTPTPLSALAGSYMGQFSTVGTTLPQYPSLSSFTLGADGSFNASAAGCSFAGTIAQRGGTGVFDAAASVTGSACPLAGTMRGLVTPLTIAGSLTRLGFQLISVDQTASAMFYIAK